MKRIILIGMFLLGTMVLAKEESLSFEQRLKQCSAESYNFKNGAYCVLLKQAEVGCNPLRERNLISLYQNCLNQRIELAIKYKREEGVPSLFCCELGYIPNIIS